MTTATSQTVSSSETGRTYHLDRLIRKGGFGEVLVATTSASDGLPAQMCVKITDRLSAWLREAYFAELLDRERFVRREIAAVLGALDALHRHKATREHSTTAWCRSVLALAEH